MKAKKVITIILVGIASLIVIGSGVMKLMGPEEVQQGLTKLGVGEYVKMLGIMEIVFALLFIFRPTSRLGFILLSCYFAGAIATELSHGGNVMGPVIPIVVIWIAAFVRDRAIFLIPAKEPPANA